MTPSELRFFLKYLWNTLWDDFKSIFKGIRTIARPRFWFFVFVVLLLIMLWKRNYSESLFVVTIMLFIWAWDLWEAGHWKGEMRKRYYESLKKQQKQEQEQKKEKETFK